MEVSGLIYCSWTGIIYTQADFERAGSLHMNHTGFSIPTRYLKEPEKKKFCFASLIWSIMILVDKEKMLLRELMSCDSAGMFKYTAKLQNRFVEFKE